MMHDSSGRRDSTSYISSLIQLGQFQLVEEHCNQERTLAIINERVAAINKTGPKILSLTGGAASGKSSLALGLSNQVKSVLVVSTDDFLLGTRMDRQEMSIDNPHQKYNFTLLKHLVIAVTSLGPGEYLWLPVYTHSTGAGVPLDYDLAAAFGAQPRSAWQELYEFRRVEAGIEYIVIEGDFASPVLPDYAIYLHVEDHIRLQQRIRRDLMERAYPGGRKYIVQSFNERQLSQHFPYTLPNAQTSNLLLWGYYTKRQNLDRFVYDIFERI